MSIAGFSLAFKVVRNGCLRLEAQLEKSFSFADPMEYSFFIKKPFKLNHLTFIKISKHHFVSYGENFSGELKPDQIELIASTTATFFCRVGGSLIKNKKNTQVYESYASTLRTLRILYTIATETNSGVRK